MAILFPDALSKGLTGLLFGGSNLGKVRRKEGHESGFSSAA